jgi:hypothetical protein
VKTDEFIMMPIPASQFAAVCALLGAGVSLGALAATAPAPTSGNVGGEPAKPVTVDVSANAGSPASSEQAGNGPTATTGASPSEDTGEVDAAGWPWSPDLHASTKGKTKDGLWRMKVGVSRPDPKPGFNPSPATGTSSETGTASATSGDATAQGTAPAATEAPAEDDEFAAFREAAAASDATDAAAAASVPTARQFSDADLGALCNQAAVKLGDPAPIKAIIAQFVPEGQTQHSRNIPADKREEFAQAVEAKADIKFTA